MYLNLGIEIKYPKPEGENKPPESVKSKTPEEVRALRDEMRAKYGAI